MNIEWVKKLIFATVPARYQLPLRFHYERLRGRLESEMLLLDQLLGSKSVAIDIGTNFGPYCYYLSRMGKKVEGFEPLPGIARTLGAYRSPLIRVHNVALSSAPGTLQLYTPIFDGVPYPACSTFTPVEGPHETCIVPVHTLDSYTFADVCLVKIDVEGHELEVLKGAVETLRREQPPVLVEIEQRHLRFPMAEVFAFLQEQGYAGYFLAAGRLHPIAEFAYESHQQPYLADVNSPAYVNNFLFLPKDRPMPQLRSATGSR
jgi:FkbM family methyltransferase